MTAFVAELGARRHGEHWLYRGRLRTKWVGPVCPGADGSARLPMQRVSCGHGSCLRVAFARMGEVAPLWCPDCWSRGVLVDQVSGEVSCRVCVDDDGDPTAWMSQQWALSTIRAAMRLAAGLR